MCESYKKADESFNVYVFYAKKASPNDITAPASGKAY
jgi:hypothetical protein